MIKNINFVFYCAAAIKFNETLKIATRINIQGTENILVLASNMNNLKVIYNINRLLVIIIIKQLYYKYNFL